MNEAAPEGFLPAYRFSRQVLDFLFRRFYGLRVEGLGHVPAAGGALLASNHLSYLDPPVLAAAVPHRQVYFMAKKELFEAPLLGRLLDSYGSFPVERGSGDRRAVDRALGLLGRGQLMGIYPEGTRSPDGSLQPGRIGVAALALRAGVPVVPLAVFHTRETTRRRMLPGGPPLGVRFGPPLPVPRELEPSKSRLVEVRDMIMAGLAAQLEPGPPAPKENL